ncbi:MAG TPA: DUF1549 domain-containing protein [Pirellulaceae bacterium]|nr:DUF1549 domain-containing protein [Pirellulaceae bacterium]
MLRTVCRIVALPIILAGLFLGTAAAQEKPLHERIDELIEANRSPPLRGGDRDGVAAYAPPASDGEFLRRVYLDLAGRIPSAAETRAFLADSDAEKRTKVIDKLLSSDEYVRRMSQAFHVMLMERLGDHPEWQKWLRASFAANKPWDQIVRELVNPNADDEATRGSALFFSKRLENYGQNPVDIPGMVRDTGRLFLGIDVQCCQCHDHLFVDEYKQEFFHGLFAYVGNLQLVNGKPFPAIAEKPLTKKVDFVSVFVQEQKSVGPKLPGRSETEIPVFAKGEEFEKPPDPKSKEPGALKFSTLKLLAEQLPAADNGLFKKNIANRLWWLLMGRGLVEPLDLNHVGNPPSHPELLDLVANELAAHQFDMKWLLKEIALSRAYQRASAVVGENAAELPRETYAAALEKPLSAEQLLAAMLQATGDGKPLVLNLEDKSTKDLIAKFEKAFANPAREPEVGFAPSVKAALFVLNDATVLSWLKPAGGNLAERLVKQPDATSIADELYISVLNRPSSDDEKKDVADYLAKRADQREKAVGNLIWSLLASNEFGINH